MTDRRVAGSLFLAVIGLVVFPLDLYAWTPGTHIFLGEAVLANLDKLPSDVASVIRAFPYDFLYGNIAADTSIAKKYVPVGRHCHSWNVGGEILDRAESDALRAFAHGYQSHLAADTVAHNFFVPRQLVVASRTIALGHSYWESRFETHLGDQFARSAMDVIRLGHDAADRHLDDILAPTIFSVRTSRRLFRGMVGVTETQSWQKVFRVAAEASRWDIENEAVDAYMARSFQFIMEHLVGSDPTAHRLDPSGEASLNLAKKMRIDIVKRVASPPIEDVVQAADEHFHLPESGSLPFWEESFVRKPWNGTGQSGAG